jgi:hypothetical protein
MVKVNSLHEAIFAVTDHYDNIFIRLLKLHSEKENNIEVQL